MQLQKIEFRKERDFSSVLGDTIKFLKQNFKPLFSSIILIIGPVILLTGLACSYIQSVTLNNVFSRMGSGIFDQTYFVSIGVVYMLLFINYALVSSAVFNFMCLYNEKPAGEKITVSEVASRIWSNAGRFIGSISAFMLAIMVVSAALALIGIGFWSMGAFGITIIVLATLSGILILAPIVAHSVSAAFYVVVRDHSFIFKALASVRSRLSGSFWWTWLILVVVLIGLSILQLLFNLPASIISFTDAFTRARNITQNTALTGSSPSVWLIAFYTIGMFLTTCSSAILHLVSAFNFLGHEEKHEGKGLLTLLDEIK